MEVEITGKRKKGRPRKSWEECVAWEERMRTNERNGESELEQKLPTQASRDNLIKRDVVVVVAVVVVVVVEHISGSAVLKVLYGFFLIVCQVEDNQDI